MRLLHLEVWNWRGLDHVALPELAADLNLVVGPNESGKSRLFEALRYGLFERYKGESEDKRRLKTWGSSESPTVRVDFEVAGRPWSLTKRFLRGASAELTGPGTNLSDDDAEERIRALWGTQEIKGRTETERFLGLWPLLWVQQGRAGLAPHADLNADTRTRLSEALAREVHEVAAGRVGQRVAERADAERARYFTLGGKEREELAAARARHAAATAALEVKSSRQRAAHAASDELARTLERIRELEVKVDAQRREVARAEARTALAEERGRALATRELEAKSAYADRELARQRAAERASLEAESAALRGEVAAGEQALQALQEAVKRDDAERAVARARGEAALDALAAAKTEAARAEAAEKRAARASELTLLRRKLEQLDRQAARLGAIEVELTPLPTAAAMKSVRHAREAWARAHAALDAGSARLTLRAVVPLVVDGKALAAGQDRHYKLDEPTAIAIEGVAELHVSPAGAELDRLRDAERDAREILDAHLGKLGVADVTEAEERHGRRIALEAEKRHVQDASESLGGGATEEIRAKVEALEASLSIAGGAGGAGEGEAARLAPEEARQALARAEEEVHASRAMRDAVERDAARRSTDWTVKKTLMADARARLAATTGRLGAMAPTDALDAALDAAERAWTKAEELARAVRDELQRKGDLDAATDREREERALGQLEAALREQLDQRIELDAELRHFGAESIHEEVQDAEAELEEASRGLDETVRRAEAARAVAQALTSARHEIQVRLVAPVQKKVEPYLEALLPGTRLDVGDDWTVAGLSVDGRTEGFEALSGGAKEQVGLLVRLGLAEVLGQEEPLPIVLDDCLVNTDAERQADMLRILYRASRRQQILLFSCHDVAFDRLGASRRYELAARRTR